MGSIDDRAGQKAIILTSQLSIDHWYAWIGCATITDDIFNCILQHHHRFTLTGDSLPQFTPKTATKSSDVTL